MEKIKDYVITFLYKANKDFFIRDIRNKMSKEILETLEEEALESLYERKKALFEELMVRDFTGYIPKDVNEPTLKIFEDHAELFQKWTLWQSYYINRKSLRDPLHLQRYDGMMIYIKLLNLMAEKNKVKSLNRDKPKQGKVEKPWLEIALEGVNEFKNEKNKNDSVETDEEDQDS